MSDNSEKQDAEKTDTSIQFSERLISHMKRWKKRHINQNNRIVSMEHLPSIHNKLSSIKKKRQ